MGIDFPDLNLKERIQSVRGEYLNAIEKKRHDTARNLSRAVCSREVYVGVTDRDDIDEEAVYFAKVSGIVNLREDASMAYEPVVSTIVGQGLLPENMYIFQGLYIPTAEQSSKIAA